MERNKKILIKINQEELFNYKPIVFSLLRSFDSYFEKKEKLSEAKLTKIEFEQIEDLVKSVESDLKIDYDEFLGMFKEKMNENENFIVVKPKLNKLFRLLFILEFLMKGTDDFKVDGFVDLNGGKFSELNYMEKFPNCNICVNFHEDYKYNISKTENNAITESSLIKNDTELQKHNNSNPFFIINIDSSLTSNNPLKDLTIKHANNLTNTLDSDEKFLDLLTTLSKTLNYPQDSPTLLFTKYQSEYTKNFFETFTIDLLDQPLCLLDFWQEYLKLQSPLTVKGTVTGGFKRGRALGIKTANFTNLNISDPSFAFRTGVYYGEFTFLSNKTNNPLIKLQTNYSGVLSIGYNPYFDNQEKTFEVFVIDYNGEDFYDEECSIDILGYLRSESSFESLKELVTAITYDIKVAQNLLLKEHNKIIQ